MAANKINIHNANGRSSENEWFRKKQANKFWNLIRSIYFCGIFSFKLMHNTTISCTLRLWLGSFQSPRFQFNRKRDSILIYSFHRTNSWHNRLTLYSIMYSDLVFYPSHHVSFGVFFSFFLTLFTEWKILFQKIFCLFFFISFFCFVGLFIVMYAYRIDACFLI